MFLKYYTKNNYRKTIDFKNLCITIFSYKKPKTRVPIFINKLAIIIKKWLKITSLESIT